MSSNIDINPLFEILVWFKASISELTYDSIKDTIIHAPVYYNKWWTELYNHSPAHILIETSLICFIIYIVVIRSTVDPKKATKTKLTNKEVDWLVDSWKPEPLVPILTEKEQDIADSMMIIDSMNDKYVTIRGINKPVLNVSSFDFLGLSQDSEIKKASLAALDKYGCGSCGPRGFYGTIDQHLLIEDAVAKFLGTQEAIAYSDSASAVSSAIPAFSKKGDLIILDEACSEAIITGCNLSRSAIQFFKHNDMDDLEAILKQIAMDDKRLKRNALEQRRFIIVEGIYRNVGDICPFDRLIELKEKYFYRLIVDESMSFGTLGKTGRGITEHFNIPLSKVEITLISMDTVLASVGGICVGSREVVDHQRLSGAGYCFSASSAPFLSASANKALEIMIQNRHLIDSLRDNAAALSDGLNEVKGLVVLSDEGSPVIHIALDPPMRTKEDEEHRIMQMSKYCVNHGVGVVYSKFNVVRSPDCMRPSLRVCASATLTKQEIATTIQTITKAINLH